MICSFLIAASLLGGLTAAAGPAAPPPGSPAEAPDLWLLAFVDVETTGLVPGFHEMIDVGIVMTDLEGVEEGRFFRRILPRHPERTSPEARAVNGFDAERWRELYHYFILDLPSMAWSLGLRQLDGASLARELQVADEPRIAEEHTGMTGAELNLRIYRALLEMRQTLGESSSDGPSR